MDDEIRLRLRIEGLVLLEEKEEEPEIDEFIGTVYSFRTLEYSNELMNDI